MIFGAGVRFTSFNSFSYAFLSLITNCFVIEEMATESCLLIFLFRIECLHIIQS